MLQMCTHLHIRGYVPLYIMHTYTTDKKGATVLFTVTDHEILVDICNFLVSTSIPCTLCPHLAYRI